MTRLLYAAMVVALVVITQATATSQSPEPTFQHAGAAAIDLGAGVPSILVVSPYLRLESARVRGMRRCARAIRARR